MVYFHLIPYSRLRPSKTMEPCFGGTCWTACSRSSRSVRRRGNARCRVGCATSRSSATSLTTSRYEQLAFCTFLLWYLAKFSKICQIKDVVLHIPLRYIGVALWNFTLNSNLTHVPSFIKTTLICFVIYCLTVSGEQHANGGPGLACVWLSNEAGPTRRSAERGRGEVTIVCLNLT